MRNNEAVYRGYVHPPEKVNWSSQDDVKNNLVSVEYSDRKKRKKVDYLSYLTEEELKLTLLIHIALYTVPVALRRAFVCLCPSFAHWQKPGKTCLLPIPKESCIDARVII